MAEKGEKRSAQTAYIYMYEICNLIFCSMV